MYLLLMQVQLNCIVNMRVQEYTINKSTIYVPYITTHTWDIDGHVWEANASQMDIDTNVFRWLNKDEG